MTILDEQGEEEEAPPAEVAEAVAPVVTVNRSFSRVSQSVTGNEDVDQWKAHTAGATERGKRQERDPPTFSAACSSSFNFLRENVI